MAPVAKDRVLFFVVFAVYKWPDPIYLMNELQN